MLGLQVAAPAYFVFKLVVVLLEHLDGVGVGDSAEVGVCNGGKALYKLLVNKLVEELKLLLAVLEHIADNILDHCLGDVHVVAQLRKSHFGLDHPEFRRVALSV